VTICHPCPRTNHRRSARGDSLSPLETGSRGDNDGGSGVTHHASRGDSRVTRTIQEPSTEPSSSSPSPEPARARRVKSTEGGPPDARRPRFLTCCRRLSGITRAWFPARWPAESERSTRAGGHEPRSATSSRVWRPPTDPAQPHCPDWTH
jgi:hypothetical protein